MKITIPPDAGWNFCLKCCRASEAIHWQRRNFAASVKGGQRVQWACPYPDCGHLRPEPLTVRWAREHIAPSLPPVPEPDVVYPTHIPPPLIARYICFPGNTPAKDKADTDSS